MIKEFRVFLLSLLLVSGLSACTPPSPPSFGNFGGPPVTSSNVHRALPSTERAANEVEWFPVQARFHPDGKRLAVNLCQVGATYYCRMAEYDIAKRNWALFPGQQDGNSYLYPSYSQDGKTLLFTTTACGADRKDCDHGYGQLATMPAQGGPISRLPIQNATRPYFAPDGQRVLYWRVVGSGKLASGRSIGSVSVYEYDRRTNQEQALIAAMHTPAEGLYFGDAVSNPRYYLDQKTVHFCGVITGGGGYNRVKVIPNQPSCFNVSRDTGVFNAIGRDETGKMRAVYGLDYLYAHHPRLGFLTGPGTLRFIDPVTDKTTRRILGPRSHQMADADLSADGATAVTVVGTAMPMNGNHAPRKQYYMFAGSKETAKQFGWPEQFPVLALIEVSTGTPVPLLWPHVQSMSEFGKR